jgi:uncharacterized membrane protein YfcA
MEIILYLLSGLLAGVATGLVGLSAAVIIAPLLVTLLGYNPYVAIGVALTADIFASSTSAYNYIRYKNINLKRASIMALSVVFFTILASYLSKDTDPVNLGGTINLFVALLGIRFLVYPIKEISPKGIINPKKAIVIQSVFWGAIIGLISGWFGSGGGLSMLAVLTMLLGYGLKQAVGTSVFIMTFTALVGALVHIIIGGTDVLALIVTSMAAFVGANITSIFANKIDSKQLNKLVGLLLILYGTILILIYFF